MIIGIDIDDTLSVLNKHKVKVANKYIKQNKLPFKLIDKNKQFFSEMYSWSKEECNKFWTECASDLLATAPPRRNVKKFIDKLKSDGHKIILITARSTDHLVDPYSLSEKWLNKHNICFDELCVGYTVKTEICLEKKVDVFIDDRVDNLLPLLPYNVKTLLMQTVSNKNDTSYNGTIVKSWKQVYKIISSLNK
jgi:uncharacterized HAD superfamily protein